MKIISLLESLPSNAMFIDMESGLIYYNLSSLSNIAIAMGGEPVSRESKQSRKLELFFERIDPTVEQYAEIGDEYFVVAPLGFQLLLEALPPDYLGDMVFSLVQNIGYSISKGGQKQNNEEELDEV